MNKPGAWQMLDASEFERKLLDAAKDDQVPSQLGLRMASALSPHGIAPAASAVGHGGLLFSKTGLWGFVSLSLLAGSAALYTWSTHTAAARRSDEAARVAPAAVARPVARAGADTQPAPAVESTAPAAETQVAAQAPSAAAIDSAASGDRSAALRQEIALLDRAREALQHGDARSAVTLLDQHHARFARGTLLPEAEALRIEALVRLGSIERAQRLSRRFLSTYPAHPLRERVRALAEPTAAP